MITEDTVLIKEELRKYIGKYYVYVLYRENDIPFYVGYGRSGKKQLERIFDHEAQARAKCLKGRQNVHKINIIRKIWINGHLVRYKIDSWHKLSDEAKLREIYLIRQIGREDIGTGPLCNKTSGGDGSPSLTGDGKLRQIEGTKRGGKKRAQWAIENSEAQSAMGRHLGAKRAQWMRENPIQAREIQSRAGKLGIKKALITIAALPKGSIEDIRNRAGKRSKQWARENPELHKEYVERAKKASREWHKNNKDKAREAGKIGGLTRAKAFRENPEQFAELIEKARRGKEQYVKNNPERVQENAVNAGKYNTLKAVIRKRCIELVRVNAISVELPAGRASYRIWQEFENRILAIVNMADAA